MSFGCERSCSSHRRVSNFISKVPQGGIYPKFERDRLNIFRVFRSSGSTGGGGRGGDAKTIISPNTSFGDIIRGYNNQIYEKWTSKSSKYENRDTNIHFGQQLNVLKAILHAIILRFCYLSTMGGGGGGGGDLFYELLMALYFL